MSDSFLSQIRGLIHVGANEGQERDLYAEHDLTVLWVEALPETFALLEANLSGTPKQKAALGLVTDEAGQTHVFHVSDNQAASSSIYEFTLGRDIWPEVGFPRSVELFSRTLDEIVATAGMAPSKFEALVMDTQGSELLVLKGAPRILEQVTYIKTEAADFEAYKGCTTVDELTSYLAERGFRLVGQEPFAERPAGGRYYELYFTRDRA